MAVQAVKRPSHEQVTVAWVLSLPETPAGTVATLLPVLDKWVATGFCVVTGGIGGTDLLDAPLRRPVMQLDFLASRGQGSSNPPWSEAFQAAEAVVECAEVDSPHRGDVVLNLPHGFAPVEIRDVSVITGPRRAPVPDPAGHARVTMDIQVQWTRL